MSDVTLGILRHTDLDIECYDQSGKLLWTEKIHNLVVDAGLNDSLDKYFKGSSYTAVFYVGLTTDSKTFAASNTMSSHAGWVEFTDYSGSNRPTLTLGTVSGKSVDNSANKAEFNVSASGTVGGCFVTTGQSKGGTTGVLYGGGAFSSNHSVQSGYLLRVTVTLSTASA